MLSAGMHMSPSLVVEIGGPTYYTTSIGGGTLLGDISQGEATGRQL